MIARRASISCILIAALAIGVVPATAAEPTVAEQVAKLKVGRKIKVKLNNGGMLKGRMGLATTDQFALESGTPTQPAREVRFSEVRSVRAEGLTTGQKWAIFGVVWAAVGIVAKLTV